LHTAASLSIYRVMQWYTRLSAAFFPALDQDPSCTLPHSPAITGSLSIYRVMQWYTRLFSRVLRISCPESRAASMQ
jgi:hypothetical protein